MQYAMTNRSRQRRARLAWLAATALVLAAGAPLAASAQLTAERVSDTSAAGMKTYNENCATCHGASFGGAFGPPLSGKDFVAKWKAQGPEAFAQHVRTMPPSAPNSLSPAAYSAVIALLEDKNGLPRGTVSDAPTNVPAKMQDTTPEAHYSEPRAGHDDGLTTAHAEKLHSVVEKLQPVTDAMLQTPDPSNWLSWRRTRDSQAFSPLTQIDRGNVAGLTLAWSLPLGNGTSAITPLVYDGVMFIDANGTVQALDASDGDSIWRVERPATTTRVPLTQPRGIAIYGSAVYVPTIDNHLIALDMHSGAKLWDYQIAPPEDRLEVTAAPLAVKGKIIQGVSGCQGAEYAGGCYIVAVDANTGVEKWRFHTISRPGQPGSDSWNGAPVDKRFGGSVWTAPSYDANLDLLYVGTGQTYRISTLLRPNARRGKSTDALFTNSTLALRPDTGELVWHYQHAAGDVWDFDWAFEQTLLDLAGRRTVVTVGKLGIIDALDAKTGRYLWSKDLGLQNLVTSIDPKTGRKIYDKALTPALGDKKFVCPSSFGARNWLATALDPTTGRLFVPLVDSCMYIAMQDNALTPIGDVWLEAIPRPNNDGHFGEVAAIDLNGKGVVWKDRRRAPQSSAALATAGGIMFEGSLDRWFRAVDSTDGKTLWQARLDDSPHSFPISFMVDGVQYVAVITGGGTPHDLVYRGFTPEFQLPVRQRTLWVFKLAGK